MCLIFRSYALIGVDPSLNLWLYPKQQGCSSTYEIHSCTKQREKEEVLLASVFLSFGHCPETNISFVFMIWHFCFIFMLIVCHDIYQSWHFLYFNNVNTDTKWEWCCILHCVCNNLRKCPHTTRGCRCTTLDEQALTNEDDLL